MDTTCADFMRCGKFLVSPQNHSLCQAQAYRAWLFPLMLPKDPTVSAYLLRESQQPMAHPQHFSPNLFFIVGFARPLEFPLQDVLIAAQTWKVFSVRFPDTGAIAANHPKTFIQLLRHTFGMTCCNWDRLLQRRFSTPSFRDDN